MLTDITNEQRLRKQLAAAHKALRALVNANRAYASALFLDGSDSPQAGRAATKLDKHLAGATRLLGLGTRKSPNRR